MYLNSLLVISIIIFKHKSKNNNVNNGTKPINKSNFVQVSGMKYLLNNKFEEAE